MDISFKMRPMTVWIITEHTGVSLYNMPNEKYTFVPYIFSMVPKLKANINEFNSASLPREADFSLFCREVKLGTKGKIFKDIEVPKDGEMPFGICKSAYAEEVPASH